MTALLITSVYLFGCKIRPTSWNGTVFTKCCTWTCTSSCLLPRQPFSVTCDMVYYVKSDYLHGGRILTGFPYKCIPHHENTAGTINARIAKLPACSGRFFDLTPCVCVRVHTWVCACVFASQTTSAKQVKWNYISTMWQMWEHPDKGQSITHSIWQRVCSMWGQVSENMHKH